ncbi:MAG: hypothetical protein KAJ40_01940 [Alphaproteobacteria bacterium]|nr:hypothetical protein [Alphaproteobacteria bacterium]
MIMRSFLVLAFALTFSLPSFAGVNDEIGHKGQYWQRVNSSSALYLRGPKAQQMLNRDIARCVVELRELERLGAVRDAIPEYVDDVVLNEVEARLAGWDTPERDKELFAEHSDYIDFEGCMISKGWERVKYVPFDVLEQANENYLYTHTNYREGARDLKHKQKEVSDYDHLNE